MIIIHKPLSELNPAPYNPRLELEPGDHRYRKLRQSLQQFGLVEPLVWNSRTRHLIGGHQRLNVLKELNYTEAPVAVLDLDEGQEKALNVVLNNKEAQGDWDLPKLTSLLQVLAQDEQLAATGFDRSHLTTLEADFAPNDSTHLEEEPPSRFEITLCIPYTQLEEVRPALDELINRFQLESHIKER